VNGEMASLLVKNMYEEVQEADLPMDYKPIVTTDINPSQPLAILAAVRQYNDRSVRSVKFDPTMHIL
jgi:hypothetical protein